MLYWLGLLAFLASSLLTTPAAAFCRLTTKSPSTAEGATRACEKGGVELAWEQLCLSYTLVPSAEVALDVEAVRSAIDRSFETWMQVGCGDPPAPLPVVLGQTEEVSECDLGEYNRFGPNANTIAFVSDWESRGKDFVPEAFGLTLVWHNRDTGEILDADIQVNLNKGDIAICGDQCSSAYVDLQNVLTHEVGHFLGLAHSDMPDATMYGDGQLAEVKKRTLEGDDIKGICAIYGQREKPACERPDFAPRRGFTPKCSTPVESNSCAARPGVVGRGAVAGFVLALLGASLLARRRGLVVLPMLAVLAFSGRASAFCRLTTAPPINSTCATTGEPLVWQRSCLSYTLVRPTTQSIPFEEIRDTIDAAFEAWSEVDCGDGRLPLKFERTSDYGACTTAEYNQDAANANMVFFLDDWSGDDLPADAFALTLVWHDPESGKIYDADIQLNAEIAPFAICGDRCSGGVSDLSNVVTHEVGHFIGLGHSPEEGATMSAEALLGDTDKRTLEADDRAGACAIYGARPVPSCGDDADYLPDQGFMPECADDLPSCADAGAGERCRQDRPDAGASGDSSSSGCTVRGARATRGSLGQLACALIALVVVTRRLRMRAVRRF